MNFIIDYAKISPAVLEATIRAKVMNAFCTWREVDEDSFEFAVMGWLPLSDSEVSRIGEVLAQYV